MLTTFNVIFLGNVPDIDTTEGNIINENAGSLVGSTFDAGGAGLFAQIQSFSPRAPSFDSGGGTSAYDINNTLFNEVFTINGGVGPALFADDAPVKLQSKLKPKKTQTARLWSYALSRMPKARAYLSDGRLELDNNICERSIRPIALGRKNYLFMGSIGGGKESSRHRLHPHQDGQDEQRRSRSLAYMGA